jgi:hypothetical protein
MQMQKTLKILFMVSVLPLFVVCDSWAAPMGSAFTYQGRLIDANQAADGLYDFAFKLYDANVAGTQKGSILNIGEVDVIDGYFTVSLDFGSDVFDGNDRWLEIGVRAGELSDPSVYTVLSPRQEVTPTPYALYAKTAGSGGGADSDWIISGNNMYSGVSGNVGIGTTSPVSSLDVTNSGGQSAISGKSPWIGVYGIHNSTTGTYPGVWGDTDSLSSQASGVRGKVTSTSPGSLSAGVWGMNASTGSNGIGVRGTHDGSGMGVYGTSVNGTGVYGISTGTSGTNYGVRGETDSSTGYAGYFTGGQNYFEGNVGIGTTSPSAKLDVIGDMRTIGKMALGTSINSTIKLNLYTDSDMYGLYSKNAKTSGSNVGVYGFASGDTTSSSLGLYGESTSASGINYGVLGSATTASSGTNYGIYGNAVNSGTGGAYAGYFDGDVQVTGVLNKDYDLQIAKDAVAEVAIGANINSERKLFVYTNSDTYGLYCQNARTSGTNYGVYATSHSYNGRNYALFGIALAESSGDNYGIYAEASNDGTGSAWAGYFYGKVYVTDNVSALSFTDRTPYPKDLATAYAAVMSMEPLPADQYDENNKENQLNHSKLSSFIRSEDGNRDLSATVSCLNEVVKDLVKKVESQQHIIELQNKQIQQMSELLQTNYSLKSLAR